MKETKTTANRHFDVREVLTRGQYEMLVAARRIYLTEANFTQLQAIEFLPPMSEEENEDAIEQLMRLTGASRETAEAIYGPPSAGRYGGNLIASSLEEAESLVKERGFGEVVVGRLGGAIQLDDEQTQRIALLN